MHLHISLKAIGVAQDDVRTGLPFDDETRALQFRQSLTRFLKLRRKVRGLKIFEFAQIREIRV
jgi:hypothetical protein